MRMRGTDAMRWSGWSIVWRLAGALAGFGLWRWLGLEGLSLGPLLDMLLAQEWLPARAGEFIARVPPDLAAWLLLALAVLGPLTGSLFLAILFAAAAAGFTTAQPVTLAATTAWPPPVDPALLAPVALVGYLLVCRAARLDARPAARLVSRPGAALGGGPDADPGNGAPARSPGQALLRVLWSGGLLAGPLIRLALALGGALLVVRLGHQAGSRWGSVLSVGESVFVLVAGLALWLALLLLRQIVRDLVGIFVSDPARGRNIASGVCALFWLKQRRSIDTVARNLLSLAGGDAREVAGRMRAGRARAAWYLAAAGALFWARCWLATARPELLAAAKALLIELARAAGPAVAGASEWIERSLAFLANKLWLLGGMG